MAASSSADEVEREHLAKLGPALGPVFHDLYGDVCWLHVKWNQYREVFGTSEEIVDLMNRTAPLFTRVIQDALWEDTLLHLCRLTDRVTIAGHTTLVLRSIIGHLGDAAIRSSVEALVDKAQHATLFARDWRNRRIAHRDAKLRLDRAATPLAPASRRAVEDALGAIREVLNAVYATYVGGVVAFEHVFATGGAEGLIARLRSGERAEKEQAVARRRTLSGEP